MVRPTRMHLLTDWESPWPMQRGNVALLELIKPYKAGRGTLRFLLDKPIAYPLISRVAKELLKGSLAKAAKERS